MHCPHCTVDLLMADRQGVEIDYCPKCRGIWLDRGELEKLVELSAAKSWAPSSPSFRSNDGRRSDHYADRRDESHHYSSRPRKKEPWLSKLLDFD